MARIVPGMRELLFGADAGGSGRDIKAADGAVTGTPSDAGSRTTGRKLIMSGSPPAKGATGSMTSRWSAEKTGRPSWKNVSRTESFRQTIRHRQIIRDISETSWCVSANIHEAFPIRNLNPPAQIQSVPQAANAIHKDATDHSHNSLNPQPAPSAL